jgi:hypothetical protein
MASSTKLDLQGGIQMFHFTLTRRERFTLVCSGLRGFTSGTATALITWLLNLIVHQV